MAKWCTTCDRPVEGETCEVCGQSVEEPAHEPIPWRWRFFIVITIIIISISIIIYLYNIN